MRQVRTVAVIIKIAVFSGGGFGSVKNTGKFDDAVNEAIREIDGEVIDIKFAFWQGVATAMIIYDKK